MVTPEQAQKLCPIIQVDDLKGGLWIPGDGVCNPYEICISLLELAKAKGNHLTLLPFDVFITQFQNLSNFTNNS